MVLGSCIIGRRRESLLFLRGQGVSVLGFRVVAVCCLCVKGCGVESVRKGVRVCG